MVFSARLICQRLISVALTHGMCTSTRPSKSLFPPCKLGVQNWSSPGLMLPPTFDDNTCILGYNFYNLVQDRVQTLPQARDLILNPIRHLHFCGSSHGWIGMFNRRYPFDLFIYNPISLRLIKLPPVPMIHINPWPRHVKKLILSCSPDVDEQNCRVLIIYDNCAAAFCCLQAIDWTLIGNTFLREFNSDTEDGFNCLSYKDFVHSTRQNLFFGLNSDSQLETWDLSDPSSPVLLFDRGDIKCHRFLNNMKSYYPYDMNIRMKYLVVADQLFEDEKDHVLMVTRYVIDVTSDGACLNKLVCSPYNCMAVDFIIHVYDQEGDDFSGLDSLGDLALFIGNCSDSVVLSVTNYPELKSNSIYFTDHYMETTEPRVYPFNGTIYFGGGHDIGIFNYENKTVSPCYYPCDRPNLKRLVPSPMWFFPAPDH